ncbi:hypothetical protein BsWGS_07406 [Bradybaena similaris]
MLYPRDSESRQTKLLDGVWQFRADISPARNQGFLEHWWKDRLLETGPVIDIPVPASYNDITEDKSLRDFIGWAWYDREFFVSPDWATNRRVVLRFDSAHYNAVVWVNGQEVVRHEGGHLPFEVDVRTVLKFDGPNYVTVAVNNTLTPTTLPPGSIQYQNDATKYPPGYFVQNLYQMDFFNYAGIHRHVRLYTTPLVYIDDITILTNVYNQTGWINYTVTVGGGFSSHVEISVEDANHHVVASSNILSDLLEIQNPTLWWPLGLNATVGYLYTLKVNVSGDIYRQPFGIRTVRATEDQFLINEKPFYCLGVGKHEDADFRGRGLDYTLIAKDFNMLRWLGVNCIRTSHYPYAEEIMDFADRQGVAVIDESPGVSIINPDNFGNVSLQHHLEVMSELIRRDKNKPSVIMWSVANEPASDLDISVPYFKTILDFTKASDPAHRPTTFVTYKPYETDKVVQFADVICMNHYYGWYTDTGRLEVIRYQMQREFAGFRNLYRKPILVTEYGVDTVPGLHMNPSFVFSEEYQVSYLHEHHKVFDQAQQFLIGEMVWNFADFATVEGIIRVGGNRKGLLTRQRQPKAAAFIIRDRYNDIINGNNGTCGYSHLDTLTSKPHSYIKQR